MEVPAIILINLKGKTGLIRIRTENLWQDRSSLSCLTGKKWKVRSIGAIWTKKTVKMHWIMNPVHFLADIRIVFDELKRRLSFYYTIKNQKDDGTTNSKQETPKIKSCYCT